jgi:hypothetical protein
LGTGIIKENILKEKSLSEKDKGGRSKLCVSVDAGWNNRGSGRAYNSNSGHHLTIGNRTGKVVALHYMSKRCVKCELEKKHNKSKQHDEGVCSRNYHGSSKGMESHGALKSIVQLHQKNNCVMEYIVMDNDSTTMNILQ